MASLRAGRSWRHVCGVVGQAMLATHALPATATALAAVLASMAALGVLIVLVLYAVGYADEKGVLSSPARRQSQQTHAARDAQVSAGAPADQAITELQQAPRWSRLDTMSVARARGYQSAAFSSVDRNVDAGSFEQGKERAGVLASPPPAFTSPVRLSGSSDQTQIQNRREQPMTPFRAAIDVPSELVTLQRVPFRSPPRTRGKSSVPRTPRESLENTEQTTGSRLPRPDKSLRTSISKAQRIPKQPVSILRKPRTKPSVEGKSHVQLKSCGVAADLSPNNCDESGTNEPVYLAGDHDHFAAATAVVEKNVPLKPYVPMTPSKRGSPDAAQAGSTRQDQMLQLPYLQGIKLNVDELWAQKRQRVGAHSKARRVTLTPGKLGIEH
ncbi:hypothetical protein FVE85_1104 [Porphyridium purpureum]|uniref:Uncharacterized protein n=1 Tax=Porphyridium purpureum TaxID=35688 RepID=A0A5J4Z254_PORPP|nr:hypothetical protein FVE85_1104 [Porphyridium purpureum]|eukprot:POR4831..scf208_2